MCGISVALIARRRNHPSSRNSCPRGCQPSRGVLWGHRRFRTNSPVNSEPLVGSHTIENSYTRLRRCVGSASRFTVPLANNPLDSLPKHNFEAELFLLDYIGVAKRQGRLVVTFGLQMSSERNRDFLRNLAFTLSPSLSLSLSLFLLRIYYVRQAANWNEISEDFSNVCSITLTKDTESYFTYKDIAIKITGWF